MQGRPTGVVAACKDINLGREIQELFASPNMRVNTTTDVTGAGGVVLVLWLTVGVVGMGDTRFGSRSRLAADRLLR
jgi:glycerol-3-phosphate dehydrogenase (NAD+)